MTSALARYSQGEFEAALRDLVKILSANSFLRVGGYKRAFLLGGQSGAGKTTLHKILGKEFCRNCIVINGDEYRAYHPRFRELNAKYGAEAVVHTAKWAGEMTEALIETFSLAGYNLIIEGTLRTSQVPLKTTELLRGRGYGVSLALMAVKPEISLISCQIRYECMRQLGTTPRATDPAHHNKIVQDIVGNIGALEESGLFDEVRIYTRWRDLVYPGDASRAMAADALAEVLFGEWSPEERAHFASLRKILDDAHADEI